jgi:histone H3/H4
MRKIITRNQIKNFAHSVGVKISEDAKEELISYVEKEVKKILLRASELAKHRKRKIIGISDVRIVLRE